MQDVRPLKSRERPTLRPEADTPRHVRTGSLMHGLRVAIPQASPLASAEFATIRERLIKIGARVSQHIARIRVHLPTSCPEGTLFRTVALGLLLSSR
jgi:hypothetical protein